MKDSLKRALKNARLESLAHPDIIFYVMDKVGKRAVTHTSEWCYKERILEGYHTVAKFKNGEPI